MRSPDFRRRPLSPCSRRARPTQEPSPSAPARLRREPTSRTVTASDGAALGYGSDDPDRRRHYAGQQHGDRPAATCHVHVVPARRVGLPVLHQPSHGGDAAGQPAAAEHPPAGRLPGHSADDSHNVGLHHQSTPSFSRCSPWAITARSTRSPLGPSFMYDSSHNFLDPTYGQFATYAQNLVQYYNTGGFTDAGGTFHKSPSPYPITWWGIYNEPNYNNVSPAQYVQLYNATVPVDAGRRSDAEVRCHRAGWRQRHRAAVPAAVREWRNRSGGRGGHALLLHLQPERHRRASSSRRFPDLPAR